MPFLLRPRQYHNPITGIEASGNQFTLSFCTGDVALESVAGGSNQELLRVAAVPTINIIAGGSNQELLRVAAVPTINIIAGGSNQELLRVSAVPTINIIAGGVTRSFSFVQVDTLLTVPLSGRNFQLPTILSTPNFEVLASGYTSHLTYCYVSPNLFTAPPDISINQHSLATGTVDLKTFASSSNGLLGESVSALPVLQQSATATNRNLIQSYAIPSLTTNVFSFNQTLSFSFGDTVGETYLSGQNFALSQSNGFSVELASVAGFNQQLISVTGSSSNLQFASGMAIQLTQASASVVMTSTIAGRNQSFSFVTGVASGLQYVSGEEFCLFTAVGEVNCKQFITVDIFNPPSLSYGNAAIGLSAAIVNFGPWCVANPAMGWSADSYGYPSLVSALPVLEQAVSGEIITFGISTGLASGIIGVSGSSAQLSQATGNVAIVAEVSGGGVQLQQSVGVPFLQNSLHGEVAMMSFCFAKLSGISAQQSHNFVLQQVNASVEISLPVSGFNRNFDYVSFSTSVGIIFAHGVNRITNLVSGSADVEAVVTESELAYEVEISYVGLAQLKRSMSAIRDYDDDLLQFYLGSASRRIDQYCNRSFYPIRETKWFAHPEGDEVYENYSRDYVLSYLSHRPTRRNEQLYLEDDLLSCEEVATNGGDDVISPDDYRLVGQNKMDSSPYESIVITNQNVKFDKPTLSRPEFANKITGIWGYHNNYKTAWIDTFSKVTETMSALSPRIHVDQVFEVDIDGFSPQLDVGVLIKIGDEWLITTDYDNNKRSFTVKRGVNGTQATSHEVGDSIYVYRPMDTVVMATIQVAIYMYKRKDALQSNVVTINGIGEETYEPGIPKDTMSILDELKRVTVMLR